MSKEHMWPDWMGEALAKFGVGKRLEVLEHMKRENAPFGEITRRVRDGGTHTMKVRVVCETCNNEWMSGMESAAQKYLEPMMHGRSLLLDVDAQRILAEWIALKVLVLEYEPPVGRPASPIYSQTARDAFVATRAVPFGFKIWIGRVGGTSWKGSIERFSSGIISSPTPLSADELPPASAGPNIQSVTWGIGHLLVHVVATTDPDIDRDLGWDVSGTLTPLWPTGEQPVYWPNTRALPDVEIAAISRTLSHLTRSGKPVRIGVDGPL